jgi:hypothetical protein
VVELLAAIVALVLYVLLVVVPSCRLVRRTGHSAWLGLAVVVPVLGLLLLNYLAYARWPARPAQ